MYYNTTNELEPALSKEWLRTAKQDNIILSIFERYTSRLYTPFEVQDILEHNYEINYPITSIRRSINTLTNDKKIVKTVIKRKGIYGKSNFTWRYNND